MGHETSVWMPVYWGDYLRDTSHLTTEEHGAYLLLIAHYWTTGKPLPDDAGKLARIARMGTKKWNRLAPTIRDFFSVSDGTWRHKRIDLELHKTMENKEKRIQKAQKAASARWGNNNASGMLEECPPPSPSSSDEINTTTTKSSKQEHGGGGLGDLINETIQIYLKAVADIFGSGPIRTELTSEKARKSIGEWFSSGADMVLCQEVFASELHRMKALGEQPPHVIWYFTEPISRVLREASRWDALIGGRREGLV